jgi:hypothetical protein
MLYLDRSDFAALLPILLFRVNATGRPLRQGSEFGAFVRTSYQDMPARGTGDPRILTP